MEISIISHFSFLLLYAQVIQHKQRKADLLILYALLFYTPVLFLEARSRLDLGSRSQLHIIFMLYSRDMFLRPLPRRHGRVLLSPKCRLDTGAVEMKRAPFLCVSWTGSASHVSATWNVQS